MPEPAVETRLSLIPGAQLVEEGGVPSVQAPATAHRPPARFPDAPDALREALRRLAASDAPVSELAAPLLAAEGPTGAGRLQHALALLDRCALLCRGLRLDGAPLASLAPLSIYFRYHEDAADPGRPWALSRFACCRRDATGAMLESPLGHAEVRLQSPLAGAALVALATPRTAAQLAEAVPRLGEAGAAALLGLLANAGALTGATDEGGVTEEDADATRAQWEFHDLLFHTRSRLGRHGRGFGGTFRFHGRLEPQPGVKPAMSEERVELARPDLEKLSAEDRPFSAVLESRRSVREQGEAPLSAAQLGEFLYRSARIQRLAPDGSASFRPSPAGGALHELEVYPLVSRCDGLESGLYHYDPHGHALEKLPARAPYVQALLQMAMATAELKAPPQVLLVLAARFQRVQWKYESMAYALVLKNVGALYQTMYLVATAMGLAPCALGGGHADLFAQAAGLDYLQETSVGELVLGSARG